MARSLYILFLVSIGLTVKAQNFFGTHNALCDCPDDYITTTEGCYKVDTMQAIPPENQDILVRKTYSSYGKSGTIVYSDYNYDGTGTIDTFLTTEWWINASPYNTSKGPLNRTGVWSQNSLINIIGFTRSITISKSQTYYIGVGCDNYASIKVNGYEILKQSNSAMRTLLVNAGITSISSDQIAWAFWMIYPVHLNQGENIIEVFGYDQGSYASVGVEIYDATVQELTQVNDYSDLGTKLLFSTKDLDGTPTEIGEGGIGYTCPDGYALAENNGNYYCKKITHIDCGQTPPAEMMQQQSINTYTQFSPILQVHDTIPDP